MELDHPPVDVLRLAARAAAVCGLVAGATRLALYASPLALDVALLGWMFLCGVLFAGAVAVVLLPEFEAFAGAALVTGAVAATLLGGGVRFDTLLGWDFGFALLFLGSGLFALSAWGWSRREAAQRPARRPTEEPEHVDGA